MELPHRFAELHDYVFTRLGALLDAHAPACVQGQDSGAQASINMSIGEPKHPMPDFVAPILNEWIDDFARYPLTAGMPELRESIAAWFKTRYGVALSAADNIIALNGTREGLFGSALALCPERKNKAQPKILVPNPFYQVYGAAALACGGEPIFVAATADTDFLPNFQELSPKLLDEVAICYLCSPSNPQGAVADEDYWRDLLALAEKHDFIIFSDECYGEIYADTPPLGGLAMAQKFGADENRVVSFHSLSKRSNLPGLRSGFAASGAKNIAALKHLRSYGAAALPMPLQRVAIAAWNDEFHVKQNRALYQDKYKVANKIFANLPEYRKIRAGFFLWLPVGDSEAAALKLWQQAGVRVVPGAYFTKATDGVDTDKKIGAGYIRVALVAPMTETKQGLQAILASLYDNKKGWN